MDIPEHKQVKVASFKLCGTTVAWWEQMQYARRREGKREVDIVQKIKQLLRRKFLLADWEHILYQKYQSCQQKHRSVSEYVDEFYRLSARNNLNESKVQLVSPFFSGLKELIRDALDLQTIWTFLDAINLSLKLEAKLNSEPSKLAF